MAVFTAANPHVHLLPQTVSVWFEAALRTTPFDEGMSIAMELVSVPDPSGSFPGPAQFNAVKRRRREQERMKAKPPEPEEQPSALSREESRRRFAEMQARLGYPDRRRNA